MGALISLATAIYEPFSSPPLSHPQLDFLKPETSKSLASNQTERTTEQTASKVVDEDLVLAWLQYWEEHGLDLTIKSWCHYYKDFMTKDFDINQWTKNVTTNQDPNSQNLLPGLDSSPPGEDDEVNISGLEQIAGDFDDTSTISAWKAEWEKHCMLVYNEEYRKFVQHYQSPETEDMPPELQNNPKLRKYWYQRYLLFTKYDYGIQLDEESWYSVTPESIANHIAQRCSRVSGTVVDGFCGVGGNTIAFAKYFNRVIAIDIDPKKIEFAMNNARIYGVQDKIDFRVGDFMQLASEIEADVVFLSPPWGGPDYTDASNFNLEMMQPCSGKKIFRAAKQISSNIAFYVPRNVNHNQLEALAGDGNFVEIEKNKFKGRVKAITAYYGDLIRPKLTKKFKKKQEKVEDSSDN